jgi:hypothetical protein
MRVALEWLNEKHVTIYLLQVPENQSSPTYA